MMPKLGVVVGIVANVVGGGWKIDMKKQRET
jgi:hypothetical protein